jgi:hypothetical protein
MDQRERVADLLESLVQPEPPTDKEVAALNDAECAEAEHCDLLARPEPQGPPKNCWLDDEPYLCPSPCVFDDPSEVIDNCLEARHLSEKNKPKEACKYYRTTARPEPQGPTDEELLRCYGLAKRDHCYEGPIDDWPKRAERAATVHGLHAVLARWGRPANNTNEASQ